MKGVLYRLESSIMFFLAHLSLVIVFATIYWIMHTFVTNKKALRSNNSKQEDITWLDCFYFSLVTQTTVGYGDIVTIHTPTRIVNMLQLLSVYGVVTYSLGG